jgi:hypothetical protein
LPARRGVARRDELLRLGFVMLLPHALARLMGHSERS